MIPKIDLHVKLVHPEATVPLYGSSGAIGLDLYALIPEERIVLGIGGTAFIKTGIAVAIPDGYYGRIAPRSGLAFHDGIGVLAGVIDPDYRGEIGVILVKHTGASAAVISNGDRIAQLILECADRANIVLTDTLPDSVRGAGGFGSTGR